MRETETESAPTRGEAGMVLTHDGVVPNDVKPETQHRQGSSGQVLVRLHVRDV